jgi:hypothetical protein
MIIGAHAIIYSRNAEADREFISRMFKLPAVDVGGGWLIFGLPPSEIAFHPSKKNNRHELYLLCEDAAKFVAEMKRRNVKCGSIQRQSWGYLTGIQLPGGGRLRVYQPLHKRPKPARAAKRGH